MFCARGGWERATWFPRAEDKPEQQPSFRRTNCHDAVAEECKAVREQVGILDLGGFTKLVIDGPGAAAWLDGLICGRLPKQDRITPLLHAERPRRHRQRVHHHPPRREPLLSHQRGGGGMA